MSGTVSGSSKSVKRRPFYVQRIFSAETDSEICSIGDLGHHPTRMEVGTSFTDSIAALTTVIRDRRSMAFCVNGTARLLSLGRFFIWRVSPSDSFLLRFGNQKNLRAIRSMLTAFQARTFGSLESFRT